MTEYLVLFTMGLTGSLHCAGMCGPICLALMRRNENSDGYLFRIVIYHLSRIESYIFLGIALYLFSDLSGINQYQNIISVVSGIAILVFVFFTVFWYKLESFVSKFPLYQFVNRELSSSLRKNSISSFALSGYLNGLLPCGLVYIALINSFQNQNIESAILSMMFFGIGTLPMMIAVSLGSGAIRNSVFFSRKSFRVSITTLLALFFILRGLNLGIPFLSPQLHAQSQTVSTSCH